ncbi:MAG: hypothetical protein IJ662_00500 [Clostridia bacterium]|nr:hypothetical protein [Clostridia bacterium]
MTPEQRALLGRQVALSTPDGQAFRFQVAAVLPYAGKDYAVLAYESEADQLLVTHLETGSDSMPVFHVATEDDVIDAVLKKFVDHRVAQALNDLLENEGNE